MSIPQIYPWQQADWAQAQQWRANMPHAILLYGEQGIGKLAFAEALAASLLCEQPLAQGFACGECASCTWLAQYSHPDFRRVRPEALDTEESDEPIDTEDSVPKKSSSKAPSRDIRIEQVRALSGFMNVSTHRAGQRVVLLYPAEALNGASANALLKTLEEPPPATVFLLVSHRIDRLLPTLRSRCRQWSLTMPDSSQSLAWLQQAGIAQAQTWLAEQGGAPLAAAAAAQGESVAEREEWLNLLARPDKSKALLVAERLHKLPLAQLVAWYQRWLYDLYAFKLSARVRYFPQHQKALAGLADRVSLERLQQALQSAGSRRAVADHPLSARLFVEDLLMEYAALF